MELTSPAVPTAQTTAQTLLVGLIIYLIMGEHTSIAYVDLKKYTENIETVEEIEAIPSQFKHPV